MRLSSEECIEFKRALGLLESIEYPCSFDEFEKAKTAYDILNKVFKEYEKKFEQSNGFNNGTEYNPFMKAWSGLVNDYFDKIGGCCEYKK